MPIQNFKTKYDDFLQQILGLNLESVEPSLHVYPADPQIGNVDVYNKKQERLFSTHEQAANAIR